MTRAFDVLLEIQQEQRQRISTIGGLSAQPGLVIEHLYVTPPISGSSGDIQVLTFDFNPAFPNQAIAAFAQAFSNTYSPVWNLSGFLSSGSGNSLPHCTVTSLTNSSAVVDFYPGVQVLSYGIPSTYEYFGASVALMVWGF